MQPRLLGQGADQHGGAVRPVRARHVDHPLGVRLDDPGVATQGPAAAGFWGLTLRYLKAPATLVGGAVSQALYPKLALAGARPTRESRRAVLRVMGALALFQVADAGVYAAKAAGRNTVIHSIAAARAA